jgi:lysine-N-methylase
MSLPIKSLPLVERWDCHQCGVCCRGSRVGLSAEDLARLKAQGWDRHPDFQGTAVTVRESWLGSEHRLAQRDDGSCVFLMADGLCRIHKEHGFEAKPLMCRMFPLQIVPREGVAYVTIRRACPSAAADLGRTVAEQLDSARKLARERGLAESAPRPPAIKPGEERPWRVARRLLETFQRLFTDERYPPVRRIVHALVVCRLLDAARTRPMGDDALLELFGVLESHVADEAAEFFSSREMPDGWARTLFRQTAAEFVRLHPHFDAQPGWVERWRLAVAAWKLARGRGSLPKLHPKFPDATFEQLEQPLGALDAAVYQPLARMVETTATSWSYALAGRGGWSVVESVRMLALLYPVGLWMLRWIAAGRQPAAADMPEIITALDRGQGYAPLSGGKQRWRLRTLARMEQLERLVAWYAR